MLELYWTFFANCEVTGEEDPTFILYDVSFDVLVLYVLGSSIEIFSSLFFNFKEPNTDFLSKMSLCLYESVSGVLLRIIFKLISWTESLS